MSSVIIEPSKVTLNDDSSKEKIKSIKFNFDYSKIWFEISKTTYDFSYDQINVESDKICFAKSRIKFLFELNHENIQKFKKSFDQIVSIELSINRIKDQDEQKYSDEKNVRFIFEENSRMIRFKLKDDIHSYNINEFKLAKDIDAISVQNLLFVCKSSKDYENFDKCFKRIKGVKAIGSDELLKDAFSSEFIENDKEYVLSKLKEHINGCFDQWSKNIIYAPVVVICQSSGYGKSKSLYEYAKSNISTFFCLRNEKYDGFPPCSQLKDRFITSLKENEFQYFLYALIETSIKFYDLIVKENPNLNREQIAFKFTQFQPWLSGKSNDFRTNGICINFEDKVKELFLYYSKYNDQKYINDLRKSFEDKIGKLTISIDEAHVLTDTTVNDKSLYRILSIVCRDFFSTWNIVFAMTSTNTSIYDFILSDFQITESQRKKISKIYPPFCELVYCDQLKSQEYENEFIKSFENKTLYVDLPKRDPVTTTFYYGRPLWPSINIESIKKFKNEKILNLAKVKLIKANDWNDPNINKKKATMAILGTRTNILNCVSVINRELSASLVAGYMATLFNINESNNLLSLTYVSEPILAEAAAFYMSCNLFEILQSLHTMLFSTEIVDNGFIGELIGQIIFLNAQDMANLKNQEKINKAKKKEKVEDKIQESYFSDTITVEDFLINLIGNDNFETHLKQTLNSKILKAKISFTHFIQKIDILNKKNLLEDFLMRCASGIFKPKFPMYDLFIPLVFEDGEIGMILIQIKNIKSISQNELLDRANKLNYDIFKKQDKSKYITDIIANDNNCFKIFLNLGGEIDYINNSNNALIMSGLKYFDLKQNIRDILNEILNFSRVEMRQYKDAIVCRRVTFGRANIDYFKVENKK